jgi:hypothetical protein
LSINGRPHRDHDYRRSLSTICALNEPGRCRRDSCHKKDNPPRGRTRPRNHRNSGRPPICGFFAPSCTPDATWRTTKQALAPAVRQSGDVRFGSKANIPTCQAHVRFTPESGHRRATVGCPLSATSGRRATRVYCDSANVGFRASRPICGGRAFIIKGGLRLVPFDFVLPGTGKS